MPIHDWTRVDEGIFHAFHVNWTVELAKALNRGVLPAEYYALPEQVAGETRPDVLTLHQRRPMPQGPAESGNGGHVATLAPPRASRVMTITAPDYSRLSRLITIRHVSADQVVAIVELVSRSNKRSVEELGQLVGKTCNALRLGIHVLAVDLYPPGPRDPQGLHALIWESLGGGPVEFDGSRPLAAVSYEALGRAADSQQIRAYVDALAVGDDLPDMPLFLRPGEHVTAPLETTYLEAFASIPLRWRTVLEPAQGA